ncbi:hypothetical protein [Hymenobacter wooponensis]|uniref:DUF4369 domain-containing protein n=1 Tax=Hymenobacter wooponensis TaxID=1525360 RepID=A0A4Z0MKH6_9BACT|nr:hypothetical protein [Hymenobacter wooponensis]TGD79909.1 hypothetical protein EU557_17005 [Hymenobacter wooponensis]
MRFSLLLPLVGLLFSRATIAQIQPFNTYKSGSYVLLNDRTHRIDGQLKLKSSTLLLVKDDKGKSTKLAPESVHSFRIENRAYTVACDFEVRQGLYDSVVEQAFVEQLDSGQVILMRYAFTTGAPTMNAGGVMTGGQSQNEVYLLRWARGTSVLAIQGSWFTGGGARFREALLPYISQRPDLVQLIENRSITTHELPKLIRALNTGQKYELLTSSSTYN